MKRKCAYCGDNTEDWEIVNGGPIRCWPCGKKIREAEDIDKYLEDAPGSFANWNKGTWRLKEKEL